MNELSHYKALAAYLKQNILENSFFFMKNEASYKDMQRDFKISNFEWVFSPIECRKFLWEHNLK